MHVSPSLPPQRSCKFVRPLLFGCCWQAPRSPSVTNVPHICLTASLAALPRLLRADKASWPRNRVSLHERRQTIGLWRWHLAGPRAYAIFSLFTKPKGPVLGFSLEYSPPPFVASVFCLSLGERSTDVRSERWRLRQRAGRQLERREKWIR